MSKNLLFRRRRDHVDVVVGRVSRRPMKRCQQWSEKNNESTYAARTFFVGETLQEKVNDEMCVLVPEKNTYFAFESSSESTLQ